MNNTPPFTVKDYYIWERSILYTSYGPADVWNIAAGYINRNAFDVNLTIPGMINGNTYSDVPISIEKIKEPCKKVVKMTGRQNEGHAPLQQLYHPLHVFVKMNNELVFAKDLKIGDVLASINTSITVVYVEIFDHKESGWYKLTTEGNSINCFVDLYLTFPTKQEHLDKYNIELNEQSVDSIEYSLPTVEKIVDEPILADIVEVESIHDTDTTDNFTSIIDINIEEELDILINTPTLTTRDGSAPFSINY